MGIRMTGLVSNMDTESIVEALMEAHRTKLTKIENKKTKLEWSQEKWKDLNTKLYKLYQEQTSKLHLTSNYNVKNATSADESVVKVTADKNATEGTHSIAIKQLASTQYVTGGKLDSSVTTDTKLTDLGILSGTKIAISASNGSKNTTLEVGANTTLNDFIKQCSKVGLNASYDTKQQRLFISSSSSGADQSFEIASDTSNTKIAGVSNANQTAAKAAMNTLLTNKSAIDGMTSSEKTEFYNNALSKTSAELEAEYGAGSAKLQYAEAYKELYGYTQSNVESENRTVANNEAKQAVQEAIRSAIYSDTSAGTATVKDKADVEYVLGDAVSDPIKSYSELTATLSTEVDEAYTKYLDGSLASDLATQFADYETASRAKILHDNPSADFTDATIQEELKEQIKARYSGDLATEKVNAEIDRVYTSTAGQDAYHGYSDSIINKAVATANTSLIGNIQGYINSDGSGTGANALNNLGIGNILVTDGAASSTFTNCVTVDAADCIALYNGAELTSSSNTLIVNGMTFDAISTSDTIKDEDGNIIGYKTMSVSVKKDAEGMYKMVKDFLTSYNSILKEMNDLYYADSSRGYDPLTDDEREAMTDDQIEKWETKIKDSLLRRDTTLGGLTSAMKSAMQSVVEVDGKKYSLASFGIMTSKDYTEKGLLHIYGDKEDSTYSDKDDKLLKAINEDPELVTKVMAGIVDQLHSTLIDKMSKTSLSSALTFYNDKQMADQLTDYKKDISTMEDKLKDKEDAYYAQFTAMEKAMASLQSQQSSLASLLGTN